MCHLSVFICLSTESAHIEAISKYDIYILSCFGPLKYHEIYDDFTLGLKQKNGQLLSQTPESQLPLLRAGSLLLVFLVSNLFIIFFCLFVSRHIVKKSLMCLWTRKSKVLSSVGKYVDVKTVDTTWQFYTSFLHVSDFLHLSSLHSQIALTAVVLNDSRGMVISLNGGIVFCFYSKSSILHQNQVTTFSCCENSVNIYPFIIFYPHLPFRVMGLMVSMSSTD